MRKTRLVLEAVQHAGHKSVTFVALDLCKDSLTSALTALQGGCCPTALSGAMSLSENIPFVLRSEASIVACKERACAPLLTDLLIQ